MTIKTTRMFYDMNNVTHEDAGTYIALDNVGNKLNRHTLQVQALTLSYDVALNGKFNYSFNLDPNNCNIYFIQIKDGEEWSEINVVYKGRLQSSRSRGWICGELTLIDPCHISIQDFELSCNGRYKVKDLKNNLVYSVELIAISPSINVTVLVVSIVSAIAALMCCCCCIKCSNKSSKKEIDGIVAANDPAAQHNEYEREPAVLLLGEGNRPPETPPVYPYSSTSPQIHNPTLNVPPSYSQVVAPSRPSHDPTVSYSANPCAPPSDPTVSYSFHSSLPPPPEPTVPDSCGPTAPLSSDPMPQFEWKGLNLSSAAPLSSDSNYSSVYTSDKLNFL
ncbi:uncharacterized protein LOC103390977 isoform X2 [Cynoglossus semilaevis]|nr:uncharacterized protein LOC103390977 isoform X2 [Cynoglossus semilaevis]